MDRMRTPLIGALLALAVAIVLTTGALADSEGGTTVYTASTKNQWATINICDTPRYQDALGIRARMPALDRPVKMKMRFFVQYMKNGAWVALPSSDGGTTMSDWILAGTGEHKWEELGRTFTLTRLQPGDSYRMRGLVKFQWRRHGKVIKRAHAYTSGHHSRGDFGDPKGYTAATCMVSGSV
jgi:hypothetical protein